MYRLIILNGIWDGITGRPQGANECIRVMNAQLVSRVRGRSLSFFILSPFSFTPPSPLDRLMPMCEAGWEPSVEASSGFLLSDRH